MLPLRPRPCSFLWLACGLSCRHLVTSGAQALVSWCWAEGCMVFTRPYVVALRVGQCLLAPVCDPVLSSLFTSCVLVFLIYFVV